MFERELFLTDSLSKGISQPLYLKYTEAVEMAKINQPKDWNPNHPSTIAMQDLFAIVKGHLPVPLNRWLKLYVSLGTSLDIFHGVDAFFETKHGKNMFPIIVTLDVSLRLKNRGQLKADELITRETIDNILFMRITGERIAKKLVFRASDPKATNNRN